MDHRYCSRCERLETRLIEKSSGGLIGIEILSTSSFIRDSMLDTVQARVLDLADAKSD
jgi:hypothetical protein